MDLPVETPRTSESEVNVLRTVDGSHHCHGRVFVEPVHQRQKLSNHSLRRLMGLLVALACDAIDLIEEDDRGGVLACVGKDPPKDLLAFGLPLAENCGPADLVERGARDAGDDPRKHCFPSPGVAGEKDSLDRRGADLLQLLTMMEGQLD